MESEFECYGKEQEFPEDILKYMDLTKEEAEAIWTDPDEEGSLSAGWVQEDGQWKYRMRNGAYKSDGWLVDGGKWYYLGTDGAMVKGAYTSGGYWVNAQGAWEPYHR